MDISSVAGSPPDAGRAALGLALLRRLIASVGLLLSVLPIAGLLVLAYITSVGGAPGMAIGLLALPALAASVFGCVLLVGASRRRLRALVIVPVCMALFVALVPLAQRITYNEQEAYFSENIELFRIQAEEVLGGIERLRRVDAYFENRKMPIYALTDKENAPQVVGFVLAGTLGHYAGFAFSASDEPPVELGGCFVKLWRPHDKGVYYFVTGDNPEYN